MAKIIKVASSTSTPRIANQFKTSRTSTTNPFKYQNFEGNTLDVSAFADVFEHYSTKEPRNLKLIASSIAGSMHKIKAAITEPIVKFVGRIREGVSSAWDYAVNTNISDVGALKSIGSGIKNINDYMNKPIELPHIDILGGIKSGMNSWHADMIGLSKDIGDGWSELISRIKPCGSKISADMSVADLEAMWKSEMMAGNLEEVA